MRKLFRTSLLTDRSVSGYKASMLPTRRAVLLSGAALAAIGGLGYAAADLGPVASGGLVLSEAERDLVGAVGDALFPRGGVLPVAAADVDLPALVDDLLGDAMDPQIGPLFRYLLRVLDLGTFASRGARFAELPLDARRDVLATWSDNAVLPRRLMYDSLKSVLGIAFFDASEVRAGMGWEIGTCHGGTA